VIGIVILVVTGQISIVVFGTSIFEMGALFFIQKFFFVAEGDEVRIERLENELKEAKRAPGMGMALSYFYNFIIPTAVNLRNEEEEECTPIDMEIKRGEMAEYSLKKSHLLVFVPRNLDGSDMKVFLRNISQDRQVLQGKPKEKPGKATHRPMFVYFLEWNQDTKTCNGLFDIPTIISSIWDRAQDEIKHHPNEKEELILEMEKEIMDFQNKLHQLVAKNEVTRRCVRILSMPPLPFQFDQMKEIALKVLETEIAKPTKTFEKKKLMQKIQEFKIPFC